jgi:hypothetical protein
MGGHADDCLIADGVGTVSLIAGCPASQGVTTSTGRLAVFSRALKMSYGVLVGPFNSTIVTVFRLAGSKQNRMTSE